MNHSSRRRAFLAGAAGAFAATSGCVGEIRNITGRQGSAQLSLTISTLPAGNDPYAVRIANRLADNLQTSGIDTIVDAMPPDVLLRETLVNHNFDIYVAKYPSQGKPDELYSMLYSSYAEESGWQNPFGFSDLSLDELLSEQRMVEGDDRIEIIKEIQRQAVRNQPFTVVAFPDRIGAYRPDRFDSWPRGGPDELTDYLQLDRVGETTTLQMLLRNEGITRNRNPIAVEHRSQGDLIDLFYEPLIRDFQNDQTLIPWLARTVEFEESEPLAATIQLRETPWHDGEAVTARDVEFTYRFLQDTSLGEFETPVPTPWQRGRISIVESVTVHSESRLRIEFAATNRELARRALTTPILPEHIWRDRTHKADLAGIDFAGQTTNALINSNEEAIGSGPVRFDDATIDESISFVTFPDHFLYTGDTDGIPDQFTGQTPFDRLEATIVPSHDAAVQLLLNDEADAAADGLQADVVPRIARSDDISLTVRRANPFYHVGYNCRQAPMTDPHFRRTVARHIDRAVIVESSLGGYGVPSELAIGGPWAPQELRWDGEAELPFFGEDGEFDVEAAQDAFREAGYQYENDQLIMREGE